MCACMGPKQVLQPLTDRCSHRHTHVPRGSRLAGRCCEGDCRCAHTHHMPQHPVLIAAQQLRVHCTHSSRPADVTQRRRQLQQPVCGTAQGACSVCGRARAPGAHERTDSRAVAGALSLQHSSGDMTQLRDTSQVATRCAVHCAKHPPTAGQRQQQQQKAPSKRSSAGAAHLPGPAATPG